MTEPVGCYERVIDALETDDIVLLNGSISPVGELRVLSGDGHGLVLVDEVTGTYYSLHVPADGVPILYSDVGEMEDTEEGEVYEITVVGEK